MEISITQKDFIKLIEERLEELREREYVRQDWDGERNEKIEKLEELRDLFKN